MKKHDVFAIVCCILLALSGISLIISIIMIAINSHNNENSIVHITVISDGETILEYTRKEDSFTSLGKSYVFTVDDEKYYFENVDSVKVEKIDAIETEDY